MISDELNDEYGSSKNKEGQRWQTRKKIKVTKKRVAEAENSQAVVRVAVENRVDNMLAAARVVVDKPVDSIAAVEAVATADR